MIKITETKISKREKKFTKENQTEKVYRINFTSKKSDTPNSQKKIRKEKFIFQLYSQFNKKSIEKSLDLA